MNMDDFYDHIQYIVPENSVIFFSILPETRYVSLKLLEGVADIYVKDKRIRFPLQQECSIQFWDCLFPRLKTKTDCNFLVRGNHYVSSAIQYGPIEKTLFAVSPIENSYSFVLEKDIQLQIFPVKSIKQESSVTIRSTRGAPEISGFKLSSKMTYHLSPFVPVLLKSSDEKPYSIHVQGLHRKVRLSIRDENHHKCANDVKDRIFASCLLRNQFKHSNMTILVLGPRNTGKTPFCQLLVNGTLENKMTPIYVDLGVKRNLSVPGSISLCKIESRKDSTLDFTYNFQKLLHYGTVAFHPDCMRLYYFLLRKMGRLLSSYLNCNREENSLSIIDTDEYVGENNTAIEHLLKSFAVDFVVYIGDKHYYKNLKNSILENVPSKFIPKPRNAELPSDSYEARFYHHKIQRYFCGSNNPSTRNIRTVTLDQLTVYRIYVSSNVTARCEKEPDCKIERVDFDPNINSNMLNSLFGVSATKRAELHGIAEVKYYVYFIDIDMISKTATVVVPESENFNGGILLMGHVLRMEESEII